MYQHVSETFTLKCGLDLTEGYLYLLVIVVKLKGHLQLLTFLKVQKPQEGININQFLVDWLTVCLPVVGKIKS